METSDEKIGARLRVAYVLKSFPEPSETFVADEIASLGLVGVEPLVLHVYQGNHSVVHPTARAVLNAGTVFKLGGVPMLAALRALFRLFTASPVRTLRAAFLAVFHRNRWCFVQSLPAAAWCMDRRINLLHAHFADLNLMYAAAIGRWLGIPYCLTTHRYDILSDPIGLPEAKELIQQAAQIVTISDFNRQHMAKKYEIPADAIKVIHCGVDLARFAYIPYNLRDENLPLRLLNVGRLTSIKAQNILLEALDIVRSRGVLFRMDIIGGGELHRDLVHQAQVLGLTDLVHFHGAQPESTVREYLSLAHLFVLSSRSEGLPVACIESLAVGTPVVATRIFGIPELIADGESGLLVPPDDAEALADAIVRVAQDQVLRARMSKAGREVVEKGFNRATCTIELSNAWRSVCHEWKGGRP